MQVPTLYTQKLAQSQSLIIYTSKKLQSKFQKVIPKKASNKNLAAPAGDVSELPFERLRGIIGGFVGGM